MTPEAAEAPSFSLREHVLPSDRSKIFELLSTGGYFYPREMAYGMALFDEHLVKGESSSFQFMLYEQGQGTGLLACGCFGALPLTDRRFHLHWLAVAGTMHKKGIGRRLEAALVARIRLQGGVKIYAEVSNRAYHDRARTFYEHCGYHTASTIRDYYGNGDDKILYVKDV